MWDVHVLVAHPVDNSVLVTDDSRLPFFKMEECFVTESFQACDILRSNLNATFSLNFLRIEAEYPFDSYYEQALRVLEVPFEMNPKAPVGYKWIEKSDADTIIVDPLLDSVVEYLKLYKQKGLDVHSERLRPPSRAGWYAEACKWITDCLSEMGGSNKMKEIRKLSTAYSGCVMQVQMMSGSRFYFKSVMMHRNDELDVANVLSRVMPHHFKKLVAIDEERRWMLMEDFGNTLTVEDCSLKRNSVFVRTVLTEWVSIQKESVKVVHELVDGGVRMFGGKDLLEELQRMVSDPAWFEAQRVGIKKHGLPEREEGEYKRSFMQYARQKVQVVEELNMPLALVHGDMNAVNMIKPKEGGKLRFFDFEGTVVSFPFLDALHFAVKCNDFDDITYDDISYYFAEWREYVSEEKMREAFGAMESIGVLVRRCFRYELWSNAEESERNSEFDELGKPAYFLFEAVP